MVDIYVTYGIVGKCLAFLFHATVDGSQCRIKKRAMLNLIPAIIAPMCLFTRFFHAAGAKTCNSLFFEDGAGAFEQTVRLGISIVSYLLPNWATIYVFYVLPRFQFSTSLDLPDLASLDQDESSYELLLNDQEKEFA